MNESNTIPLKVIVSLTLLFLSSCTFKPGDSNHTAASADTIQESATGRVRLENGIRGQVRFTGEPENLGTITGRMSAYRIPALSLALIHQGKIEWSDVYQNPDFPASQLDSTHIFQAASLSKPVTFLAAVRMQAAGEIDLDENIENYLTSYALPPGKQTADNPVTLRNIFSHTSGIISGGYQGYAQDAPLPSDKEILSGAPGVNSPAAEVVSSPNEALAYSGGGYTLAEVALQDIYGEEFSLIMKEWILDPAGMTYSDFAQPLPDSQADKAVKGHLSSGEVVAGGWRNHPEQAAAGLWSNAPEMANFLIEIYKAYQGKRSIFSPSDIQSLLNDERDGHVYGFIINRSDKDISLTHYGGNAGYRTGMTISLTSGNGLVYLINSDNGATLGNELLLSASQVYDWAHFKQTQVQRKTINPEVLKGLTGEYRWNDQVDLTITFDESKSHISLYFPNGDAYELVPVVGGELDFIHPDTGVSVSFAASEEYRSFTLYGQTAIRL